jgi:hypothetical protein
MTRAGQGVGAPRSTTMEVYTNVSDKTLDDRFRAVTIDDDSLALNQFHKLPDHDM